MLRLIALLTLVLPLSIVAARADAQCTPEAPCVLTLQEPVAAPQPPMVLQPAPAQDAPIADLAPRTRPRWGLVIGGGVMMLAAYALNVGGSAIWYTTSIFTGQGADYFNWSLVPIAGPFVQMGFLGGEEWQIPILAVVGAVQIAGIVMLIVGAATREEVAERPDVVVAPYAMQNGGGLGVAGSW